MQEKKVHPLTSTGKKIGVFTTVLRFYLKTFLHTLVANKIGVLITGFEKPREFPTHPVFHTFFAFECTKNALFSNSLQLGISQIAEGKKKSAQPVG